MQHRRAGETALMVLNPAESRTAVPRPQKIGGGHPLLAFHLQLDNLDPRILRARNQQPMIRKVHCARLTCSALCRYSHADAQSAFCLRESCTLPATAENPASDSKVLSPYARQNPYAHLPDREAEPAWPVHGPAAAA